MIRQNANKYVEWTHSRPRAKLTGTRMDLCIENWMDKKKWGEEIHIIDSRWDRVKTRPVCECARVCYSKYINYITSWWGLSYITSPELFRSVLFLKRWMFSVPDCDFSFLLSLRFHTMFITRSNRSEWMRRINQTAWQVYVFHGRQGLATWLKAVLTASSTACGSPWVSLKSLSFAGNCVGLGRQSVQSPSSVLGVYPSFPALRFISFCSIHSTDSST